MLCDAKCVEALKLALDSMAVAIISEAKEG